MSNNPKGITEYTYNYIRNPRTAEDIDKMTGRPTGQGMALHVKVHRLKLQSRML